MNNDGTKQLSQESLDLGLPAVQILALLHPVKVDVALNPIQMSPFGMNRIMAHAHHLANLLKQLGCGFCWQQFSLWGHFQTLSETLSYPFVDVLGFFEKVRDKVSDKDSRCGNNEQAKRPGRVAGANNFLEFRPLSLFNRVGGHRGGS